MTDNTVQERGNQKRFKMVPWIAGVMAAAVGLTACGGSTPAVDAPLSSDLTFVEEGPAAEKPLPGVQWGTTSAPTNLDPALGIDYSDEIRTNLCESLVRFTADGTIEPSLAESVNNPDPVTFVYDVRPGVKFWNGDDMTAEDVAFSLNRHLDPNFESHFALYFANVDTIDVTGPMQVTVRMKRPDYLFPNELATFAGAIVQKSYAESKGRDFGTKDGGLMCTGPYELKSWTPESIELSANPNYWDPALQPKAATLTFRIIADEDTVTSALLSGDLDGATLYGSTAATRLQSAKPDSLILGASTLNTQLIVTKRPGPLQDQRVRQALSLALPRDGIAKTVYAGTAVPSKSVVSAIQPWAYAAPTFDAYFEALKPLSTNGDVTRGREIIDSAGMTGQEITIAITPQYQEVSDVIIETANAIGLKATSTILTNNDSVNLYFDEALRDRFDAFVLPWNSNVPDPLENLVYWTPGAAYNYSGYDNPEYTALVERAIGTADPDARATLVGQALTILDADLPWIPIVDQPVVSYMSEKIGGGPVTLPGRNWGQWGAYLAGR